jgi:alkylation response protein AidB-like acyl-CoA dehydrogenase
MEYKFTDEQRTFFDQVTRFAKEQLAPRSEENDLKGIFDRESFRKMGEYGLLGIHFPEEYGGSGADVVTACLAGEAVGYAGVDAGLSLSWGAHTFLCGDTILCHGTNEQKQKYLPKLASGEWIGCMGLTEPNAGSDAASISTTAKKKGDRWILNGSKTFITNAPVTDVAVVYAVTDKQKRHEGVSGFIVDKGAPGFSAGDPFHKMCMKTSTTGELFFEDCELPEESLLGVEGAGFPMALQTLEWDRSALIAPFVGSLRFVMEECIRYSRQRVQFGRPIASFQAIQHKIARMKMVVEGASNLVYRVACSKDAGNPLNHLLAAVAKLWVCEKGMEAAYEGVQVHGGYGLMHEYPVERVFRDTRLATIGGGTSEIQRMIIARHLFAGGRS